VKQEKQEQKHNTYEIRIQQDFIAKDKQNKTLTKKCTQNWC
jgi:translation elongation factor EF-Ts